MALLFHVIQTSVSKWSLCETVKVRKAKKNLTQINSSITKQNVSSNPEVLFVKYSFAKLQNSISLSEPTKVNTEKHIFNMIIADRAICSSFCTLLRDAFYCHPACHVLKQSLEYGPSFPVF